MSNISKCKYCNNYPHLLQVEGEFKFMCCWENPQGKQGYWHPTAKQAIEAWNKRSNGKEYA